MYFQCMKVQKQKIIFNQSIVVEKAEVTANSKKFPRYRVKRPDAVAIIVHNKKKKTIVMVRQFRYAIHDLVKGTIYEIPAGKIDGNDKPLATAVRETYEECGYKLKAKNVKKIAEFFAAPGYTTEKFHLYYTVVTDTDKVSKGGGLEEENEFITVEEVPEKKFKEMALKGKIIDAKTLVAAQWFIMNK